MRFGPRIRWDLTLHCNLSCRHCQVGDSLNHRGEHPSLEKVLQLVDRLNEGDVAQIGLLGGEPLSFPGIRVLLERLLELCIPVTISTNGLLIQPWIIEILQEALNWSVMVSVDGPDERTHELIRGKGTFRPTLEKIDLLVKSLPGKSHCIGMACTLNASTAQSIPAMLSLARQMGVGLLQLGCVKSFGNAAHRFDQLELSERVLAQVLVDYFSKEGPSWDRDSPKVIIDFLGNSMKDLLRNRLGIDLPPTEEGCTAAVSTGALDSLGLLWPCPSLSYTTNSALLDYFSFGENSLIDHSFETIWNSEGFEKLRNLNRLHMHRDRANPCRTCRHNQLCTPCPLPVLLGLSLDQPACQTYQELASETVS